MKEEILTAKEIEEELKAIPYPRIRQKRLLEYSRVDFLRSDSRLKRVLGDC